MADPTDPRTMPGYDAASNTMSAATNSMQSFAAEMQNMTKEQMETASELMEKLRSAKTLEEMVSVQTSFMQKSFKSYADYTRRFSEMMMSVPMEIARQSQSALQKGVGEMTKKAEQAGDQIQKAGQQFTQHHG